MNPVPRPDLYLCSASPRRKALLQQIGIFPEIAPVDIDESVLPSEHAEKYVYRLAQEKAAAGFETLLKNGIDAECVVIAADTCVSCDHHILGKPASLDEAKRTLRLLSGRTHQVLTAFAVKTAHTEYAEIVATDVTFRTLSDTEIEEYWQTGEPQDKAGSYGIQGLAAIFVERISGSYSNVVGLPLAEVSLALNKFNIAPWQKGQLGTI